MNSRGSISFFACWYQVAPELFVQKIILSPFNAPGTFIKNQLNINSKPHFWTHFYSLIYMSILNAILIVCVVSSEIRKCESSNSVLFPRFFFSGYSLCFEFLYEFEGQFVGVKHKKSAETLIGIMLNDSWSQWLSYVKKLTDRCIRPNFKTELLAILRKIMTFDF